MPGPGSLRRLRLEQCRFVICGVELRSKRSDDYEQRGCL